MKFRQLDSKPSFKEQYKTTMASFLLELINLILSLVAAFSSATLYVWTDTIQSFISTLQPFLVMIVLKGIMNDHLEEKYNYGTGRVECISGVATNVLNITCLVITFVIAIFNMTEPTQPSAGIAAFIILKITNCTGDAVFVWQQSRINKTNNSTINQTALKLYWQDLYYDLVILLIGIPCFFFRDDKWSWYLSPVSSMIICVYYIVICVKQTAQFIRELSDAAIPVNEQMRIFDIVLDNSHAVLKSVNSVNTHLFEGTVFVDIDADFKDSITCGEEAAWIRNVGTEIMQGSGADYKISLVHPVREQGNGE